MSTKFLVPADATSWVTVPAESDFPIQNLPLCRFSHGEGVRLVGSRIGDFIVNVSALEPALAEAAFTVEGFRALRRRLFALLSDESHRGAVEPHLLPVGDVCFHTPMDVRAFVDFYSGIYHASNVGKMFRPDQPPLLPNYKHIPIGYNGRASSVVVSGVPIHRPKGQLKGADTPPEFAPSRELDFELEMGFFLGEGTKMGHSVSVDQVEDLMLGMVIVNDWSARDIQRWEYQPLGPFLAKSFATSITPFLVSLDALEGFRVKGMDQDPAPLAYLRTSGDHHFDLNLEVSLQSSTMQSAQTICRSNMANMYWSCAQQLAHQSSNGTPLEPGDLYATGTISADTPDGYGSMLELSWRGTKPIVLEETGETRTFLADGDTLTMRAYGERGGVRIGFGEVTTQLLPSL